MSSLALQCFLHDRTRTHSTAPPPPPTLGNCCMADTEKLVSNCFLLTKVCRTLSLGICITTREEVPYLVWKSLWKDWRQRDQICVHSPPLEKNEDIIDWSSFKIRFNHPSSDCWLNHGKILVLKISGNVIGHLFPLAQCLYLCRHQRLLLHRLCILETLASCCVSATGTDVFSISELNTIIIPPVFFKETVSLDFWPLVFSSNIFP